MWTLVVERKSGSIRFIVDASTTLYVSDLWPAVSHHLVNVKKEVIAHPYCFVQPWNWRCVNNCVFEAHDLTKEECSYGQVELERGELFQLLGAAIDRHRAVGFKAYMHQEQVYDLKLKEAVKFKDKTVFFLDSAFPFLQSMSNLNGTTFDQEANLILFRDGQRKQILVETEEMRIKLSRKILSAAKGPEIKMLEMEIKEYGRRV